MYAHWSETNYTLTVSSGTGISSVSGGTTTAKYGQSVSISANLSSNYNFDKWTTTGGTLESSTSLSTKITMPASDVTVTAKAKAIEYKITYTLNGGTATNPSSYTKETADFTLNNPTRSGYVFAGWRGTGLRKITESVKVPKGSTGDRSYTAYWSVVSYSISYILDGGTATNPSSYTVETADFTLNNPTRSGYKFTGWTGTGLSQASSSVKIAKGSTGNRSYTANWSVINKDYTIKIYDDENHISAGGEMRHILVDYNIVGVSRSGNYWIATCSFEPGSTHSFIFNVDKGFDNLTVHTGNGVASVTSQSIKEYDSSSVVNVTLIVSNSGGEIYIEPRD